MNKPILAFLDIDGTLLDAGYASNDLTLPETIRELQQKHDYVFGINSNRSIEDMLPIAEQFSIAGPVVGENGVFAYYPSTKTTEYFLDEAMLAHLQQEKQQLEKTILESLQSCFKDRQVRWNNTDTVKAISEKSDYASYQEGDIIVLNNVFRKYTISAHLFAYTNGQLVSLRSTQVRKVLTAIQREYVNDEITLNYDPKFSNILAYSKFVSKRSAVEKLTKEYVGYQLYSIGDELNDYLMTEGIGTFLAVANASPQVRAKARYTSTAPNACGVTELLTRLTVEERDIDPTISALTARGYRKVALFKGGETAAVLYSAKDTTGAEVIIKLGSPSGDNSEIEANRNGYESLRKAGGAALLPDPIIYGQIDNRALIVMPFLGKNISDLERASSISERDYETFLTLVEQTVTASTVRSPTGQQDGLALYAELTGQWLEKLHHEGLVAAQVITDFQATDLSVISSSKASMMLLDFTPDNVFFDNDAISFIDPWDQATYQGSFVPSLAQFMTLASDVMELPQVSALQTLFERHLQEVGKTLGLSTGQVAIQVLLGKALQYSLSSFVRIQSDTIRAKEYADKAVHCLQSIQDLIKNIGKEGVQQ